MNQVNSSTRRWWQGWFSDWSACGPDRRNVIRAFRWTTAFGVLLVIGGLPYGTPETGEYQTFSIWRWLLTLAPVMPGVVAIFAWRHFIRNAEDLLTRIYTESAAFAFSVALVLFIGLFIAGRIFGEAEAADAALLVFSVSFFAFCFGLQYRLRKFNA